MKRRATIQVFGRVQGVGFRASTCRQAGRLGLAGFVRNMPDASVYMEAEGREEDLKALVEWSRHGPPAAKVLRIQVDYSDRLENPQEFAIRYW
jgi:acylphosphatase